jgi:hypothetical protein
VRLPELKRGLKLVGGDVISDGRDVTVKAPTADLTASALVSNPHTDALIIPRDEPLNEVACFRCRGTDIVIKVKFPKDEGYQLALCRDCVKDRPVGHPIMIDMEFVD